MPAIQQTIWPATAHTLAKIEILKRYLEAWFHILGTTRKKEVLLFVDGFAGPGKYSGGEEGSPVASLKAANTCLSSMGLGFIGERIYCVFFEKEIGRFNELCLSIDSIPRHGKLRLDRYHCEFAAGISALESANPQIFKSKAPTLVFADPFGVVGIPFGTLAHCMGGAASELLINLDADGIARCFLGKNNNWETQLSELFGNGSWRTELSGYDVKKLSVQILALYKKRLFMIPDVKYVWSFAMRGKHDTINYHLVFATKHPLGQKKMKEAMKTIDKSGSFSFSDAHVDQHVLFKNDDTGRYADMLFQEFKGRTIPITEVDTFALNETPFLTGKGMLAVLEDKERLKVEVVQGYMRRAKTFPDGKINNVTFGHFGPAQTQDMFL
jgi:three-Cys-motif partner protein